MASPGIAAVDVFDHGHERQEASPATDIRHIPTLDGLRAVSIVGVIISHAVDPDAHPFQASLGHVGVLIFFAISGYLITSRLVDEHRRNGRISLRKFYVRRVFRILPPALLYIGFVWALSASGLLACSLRDIKSAALLYINYIRVEDAGWRVGHFWSLSVEEHFYLLWPVLLIACGVSRGLRTAVAAALFVSVWRIADNRFHLVGMVLPSQLTDPLPYRTDVIADALFWGCSLAFLIGTSPLVRIGKAISTIIAVSSLSLLVLLVYRHVNHVAFVIHFLPALMLGAIVMSPESPIGRLLELGPVKVVGKLSYSLYIWQQMFLGGPPPRLLPMPWALLAVAGCAVASYALIEQPSIRLGRRLVVRRRLTLSP